MVTAEHSEKVVRQATVNATDVLGVLSPGMRDIGIVNLRGET